MLMISRIENEQLRHRIFQASFKGVQKAKEYGVPLIYVDPSYTSKLCPTGGEKWHRDVAACFNILYKALGGDGSPVPLGSTATHEPIVIPKSLWARWNGNLETDYPSSL